jgi:hypothetical protein
MNLFLSRIFATIREIFENIRGIKIFLFICSKIFREKSDDDLRNSGWETPANCGTEITWRRRQNVPTKRLPTSVKLHYVITQRTGFKCSRENLQSHERKVQVRRKNWRFESLFFRTPLGRKTQPSAMSWQSYSISVVTIETRTSTKYVCGIK